MKRILMFTIFSIFLFVAIASAATTSLTISWQLLDDTVKPGGTTTLFLTLSNPSASVDIGTIQLYISSEDNIKHSLTYQQFSALGAGSNQKTSLYLTANPSSSSTNSFVTVRAVYYVEGQQKETSVSIPVPIRRSPLLQVSNAKYNLETIEPGSSVALTFDLVNNGEGAAKDVRVTLNQTQLFSVAGSGEIFISSIEPSQSAKVKYSLTIDPKTSIGTYSIPLVLAYYDELRNDVFSSTKQIGLVVSGKIDFIVVLQSQDIITEGKQGKVSIQIANGGNQEALYLTAKVLPSEPLTQVSPTDLYIGNLKQDDYDIQQFTFKVNEQTSPDTYPLKLQLNYKDLYGNSYTETHEVNIKVYSLEEFSKANKSGLSPITIGVIIIASVLVVWFVYRKLIKKK